MAAQFPASRLAPADEQPVDVRRGEQQGRVPAVHAPAVEDRHHRRPLPHTLAQRRPMAACTADASAGVAVLPVPIARHRLVGDEHVADLRRLERREAGLQLAAPPPAR
jgi:hypothetical protein